LSAVSIPPALRGGPASTPHNGLRSITSPSSQVLAPQALCPPPRPAISNPCSRARRMAAVTSVADPQRAITAGQRSMSPFHTWRPVS
jgi:hypothetical protein